MSAVACRAFKEAMGAQWLEANRNRFVVTWYDSKWAVFRIYSRASTVALILSFHDKEKALEMSAQLNDLYEEGEIS